MYCDRDEFCNHYCQRLLYNLRTATLYGKLHIVLNLSKANYWAYFQKFGVDIPYTVESLWLKFHEKRWNTLIFINQTPAAAISEIIVLFLFLIYSRTNLKQIILRACLHCCALILACHFH